MRLYVAVFITLLLLCVVPCASAVSIVKDRIGGGPVNPADVIRYSVTIINNDSANLVEIIMTDRPDNFIEFLNQSSCPYTGNSTNIILNITQCMGGILSPGANYTVFLNFTALGPATAFNSAEVRAWNASGNQEMRSGNAQVVIGGGGGGGGNNWNNGFRTFESSIDSPYLVKNVSKLITFMLERDAGNESCLENLTITLPANVSFNGFAGSSLDPASYTNSSYSTGDSTILVWQATGGNFFCGNGSSSAPSDFIINVTSNRSYGAGRFEVRAMNASQMPFNDGMNMTFFTTKTFSYSGRVYDTDQNPIENATASLYIASYSEMGQVVLGTFSIMTNASGFFNITDIPSLNATLGGGKGDMGGGPGASLNYRLSVVKYNDTNNIYGMFVGPSLPDISEQELRSPWGLGNPTIYLKPAATFHVQVEGVNYRSQPINQNMSCPGPECPGWQPEFPFENIGFNYELKDSGLGYPVSNDYSSNSLERYFSASSARNYSLMIFPQASFPMYVSFQDITNECNASGHNISAAGVSANCTIRDGTYLIDLVVNANMTILNYTGRTGQTNLSAFHIIAYRLGSGDMIFDQDTLPFNMHQMQVWPKNDTTKDDFYNLTSGEYRIGLPATAASSSMMLMAYAEKDGTYYQDIFNLTSSDMTFIGGTEHNFTMQQLINGTSKELTGRNISADWNETTVVATAAVQFRLVSNGELLSNENSFIEMKRKTGSIEYRRMMNSQSGVFTVPVIRGEGIKKLTIYSQSYSPISTPISAAVLSGNTSTPTINCSQGICNVTMRTFDSVDPKTKQSMDISIVFGRSTPECDVPNWDPSCDLKGENGSGEGKDSFSPLKAMLMGDLSLRIEYNGLSVHYVKTDLMASGPPDAAFAENATRSDITSAWQFGSTGPEIYSEVLIGVPYASVLDDANITVSIPVLYDNEFNILWNASNGDNVLNISSDESLESYLDYIGTPYEAYLNGTNISCSTADENLTSGLCFKDTVKKKIWMKIPHFSGVGPEVTGTGASQGPVNFSVSKTAINSTYHVGDTIEYEISVTNNGDYNLVYVNVNDTYDPSLMSYNSSERPVNQTDSGMIYWLNITAGNAIAPNATYALRVNMTALATGLNVTNNVSIDATDSNGNFSTANASVQITIMGPPTVSLNAPGAGYLDSSASTRFNVSFNCSAASVSGNLSNISLYLSNSANASFSANQTTIVSGDNASASWNLNLTRGNYTWNCLAYDSNGTGGWASVSRSFVLNNSGNITANDDSFGVNTSISTRINVTSNDAGASGLRVGQITSPSHGTAVLNDDGSINYTSEAGFVGTDSFTYTVTSNSQYYNGTGHYYEYVAALSNWSTANSSANIRTLYGLSGYLVTINSSGENNFIWQKISNDSWIGASDAESEGVWKWVTGPEAGVQFWQGTGAIGSAVGSNYNNWASLEPNNAGDIENWAEFYYNNSGVLGKWNDLPAASSIGGYITEYGGMPGDSPDFPTAVVTIQVSDSIDPVVSLNTPSATYALNTSNVTTNVSFNCSATDAGGLENISLYITNAANASFSLNQTATVSGSTNSSVWVLGLPGGNYSWNCRAYDFVGNDAYASSNRSITINYDGTAPQVSIGKNASSVQYPNGSIYVNWSASDDVALSVVRFNVTYPNSSLLYYSAASSGSLILNSSNLTALGNYSMILWANDSAGNTNTTAAYFTVVTTTTTTTLPSGDTKPPTAAMVAPSNGSTVSGGVSLEVNASDESGIARADFYYYGPSLSYVLAGSDYVAPYSVDWDTSRIVDGKYYLFVEVFDAYGNKKTTEDAQQRVYVFVNNAPGTTTTTSTTSTGDSTSSTTSTTLSSSSTTTFASTSTTTTTTTTTGNGTSTTLPKVPGDADGDRHVNYEDLIILAAAYWQGSEDAGYDVRADYNEDGAINYADLVILAANYGR